MGQHYLHLHSDWLGDAKSHVPSVNILPLYADEKDVKPRVEPLREGMDCPLPRQSIL